MVKKNILLLLLSIAVASPMAAQLPDDFRSEQVAMRLGKAEAERGDTVDVEGVVCCMARDRTLPYSNYLYIECVSPADSVVCRQKISCKDGGVFAARLPIDYGWKPGLYYVRAYTRLMMNFSQDSFCARPLLVGRRYPAYSGDDFALTCRAVATGGHLLGGQMQDVAVMLRDEAGRPATRGIAIVAQGGDTVAATETSPAGLAMFSFIPNAGEKYAIVARSGERFAMPEVESGGIQIRGSLRDSTIRYQIIGAGAADSLRLCAFDRENGLSQYDLGGRTAGVIRLARATEVASLFLLDTGGGTVAEATLSSPRTGGVSDVPIPRRIEEGDTLRAGRNGGGTAARTLAGIVPRHIPAVPMEAEIRYLSDYRSPLPFPSESYACGGDTLRNDIHTWLATARFCRFSVADALDAGGRIYRHMPEDNMNFGGTVEQENGYPLKTGTVVAYNTANNLVYNADIDGRGQFRVAVDDFPEGEKFYIEAADKKGRHRKYQYRMADDAFPGVDRESLRRAEWLAAEEAATDSARPAPQWKRGRFDLPEVSVTARVKQEKYVPTKKFYSTHYIDREEIEKKDYHTLIDILRRLQGIQVMYGNNNNDGQGSIEIISTRGIPTLHGGGVMILLDGKRYWASSDDTYLMTNLLQMPAFEIESVELLEPWEALKYVSGAISGAINIKTRGVSNKKPIVAKGIYYTPIGLSLPFPAQTQAAPPVAEAAGPHKLMIDEITSGGVTSRIYLIDVEEKP